MPHLDFVKDPAHLPDPPAQGRLVLLDVAFAHDPGFENVTRPFIEGLGERLAGWVDHHQHRAWTGYREDPRFHLVDNRLAPACPQIVNPTLVTQFGAFDHLWAHADFDGCMTAAKVLRGGHAPYEEADEDARAVDDPAGGHRLSERGARIDKAMDALTGRQDQQRFSVLYDLVEAWVAGRESALMAGRIDELYDSRVAREQELEALLSREERVHPQILLLALEQGLPGVDKKYLLRSMQTRAKVALVFEGTWTTVATGATTGPQGLDLPKILASQGKPGYLAVGKGPEELLPQLIRVLDGMNGTKG